MEMDTKPLEFEGELRRGRWTDQEHQLFLEALLTFGKDWESIRNHI
jgi:hypothetical protein